MVKSTTYQRIQIGLAALAILFASTGFMTVIESRCSMMDITTNGTNEAMPCCATPVSISYGQPFFASAVRCNAPTLAGLPSSLISTPAQEKVIFGIDLQFHNFIALSTPSEIQSPESKISIVYPPTLRSPALDRYVLSSSFLI